MDVSIFLAKFIGLYCVIIGLVMLIKQKFLHFMIKDVGRSHFNMFIVALITLLFGIPLIICHNVWVKDWPVVITVFGWLCFIAGIVRFLFAEAIMNICANKNFKVMIIVGGIFSIIIGLFLCYYGFWF